MGTENKGRRIVTSSVVNQRPNRACWGLILKDVAGGINHILNGET